MANIYDQFDVESPPRGNVYDQFDEAPRTPSKRVLPDTVIGSGEPQKKTSGGFLQSIDDAVRLAASGATMGYADKFASYMGGAPIEEERAKTEAARGRMGLLGTAAEFAGGLAPVSKAAKAVEAGGAVLRPLFGRAATNPYAQAAVAGAGVGAGEAAGHDQDIARGAGLGAGFGVGGQAAAGLLSKGISGAAGLFNKPKPVQSTGELEALKSAAYQKAEDAGGVVKEDAYNRFADELRRMAAEYGHEPSLEPRSAGFFNVLERNQGENQTMKGLDTLRKVAGRTWEGGKSDAALGGMLRNQIDEFTGTLAPDDLIPGMGDAAAAHSAFKEARDLAQRSFKNDDVQNAIESARLRAASTGTGGNVENATRQNLRKLLESNTAWTPSERAALEGEVSPGLLRNTLRSVGGLSPDKGVIPLMANLGAAAVNPSALGLSAAALAARHGSEALQRRGVDNIGRLIRSGGDAAALQPSKNAAQRLAEDKRPLLARGLLSALLMSAPFSP
jgi:hypothetical protein